ncbi:MAG: glucoamylase family protein [Eubacteriales bacterium]|nr:glucoamylase family protein [Eubacteriales bacterium]
MRLNNTMDDTWERHEAPLDDRAMGQHMRALAVTLNVDGRSFLDVAPAQAFSDMMTTALRLGAQSESVGAALEWLCENGRLAQSYISALLPEGRGASLPSKGGKTRIQSLLTEVVRHSDAAIDERRLCACLSAFDEVRALEMNELWAAPSALAAVLMRACLSVGERAVSTERERIAAAQWAEAGGDLNTPGLSKRSGAFFEGALHYLREQDLPDQQAALKSWLDERGRSAEQICALERRAQSLDRLRLDHALSTLRMLSGIDWNRCFAAVSRTEQMLCKDPSGTYPRMDEQSRAQVRERIVALSAHSDIGENTFAAAALIAAENDEGLRREITWWLATDEGTAELLRGMGVSVARVPMVHPDPQARLYRAVLLLTALILTLYIGKYAGGWAICALPCLLGALNMIFARAAARLVRPRRLMRYKLERLGEDMRTLVIVPALLSSPDRARELAAELETLGCLEDDPMLTFVLLGDLPDAEDAVMPEDQAILDAARDAIAAIDVRGGRAGKYRLLTRKRSPVPNERRFSAHERKRGSINALIELLCGGENAFEQPDAARLAREKYAYIVTLDAGTRMLPGTAHRLVGTLALPVNRARYAMLAPKLELTSEATENRFARAMGGAGGMDGYASAQSDLWQDLAGEGSFGGKGVIDVRAFREAMAGARLPDNRILSHDLLEGLFAGAGFIDDIALYEGHPRRVRAWLDRLHRWTRGDWQLWPFLFHKRLHALDRWKIMANWVRALEPASALLVLLGGLWRGSPLLGLIGLAPLFMPLALYRITRESLEAFVMRLSLLPDQALTQLDAAVRALYRMAVSRRRLLEWTTADDSERRSGRISPVCGGVAAIAALLSVFHQPAMILFAVVLAGLWGTAAARSAEWEKPRFAPVIYEGGDADALRDLAARTWRFFAENTPENGLVPDNVQLDPPRGAAERTSPTNIGLYMVSCAAARLMGLIDGAECARRLEQTVSTLERLETWRGQFYNWYDVRTEKPMPPRYVSSVDSGNLAASLLLCASLFNAPLKNRLETLAKNMDLRALYDEERKLFVIGVDTSSDRVSASHYDLLASESRLLSITAIMLGQVPVEHFARLGRACARVGEGGALISWSGTMFEYLMPCLMLPLWPDTLLGESCRRVISAQKAASRPWGVSESGLYAFDRALNYQYRAFGLREAALRGDCESDVIAPYASALALPFDADACANMALMREMGWLDEQGFFEAADYDARRIPEGAPYRLIKSHMAHHQGMILASICNALMDGALVRAFMARPQARALTMLLQEKAPSRVHIAPRKRYEEPARRTPRSIERTARVSACDAHLMHGAETSLVWTAQGNAKAIAQGLLLNAPRSGFYVHLCSAAFSMRLSGGDVSPARQTVRFKEGVAASTTENDAVRALCVSGVSPEDGAICQRVTLENRTGAPLDVTLTGCFPVALARESDYRAHPAFQNLFIESECVRPGVLAFKRRPRGEGESWPELVYMAHDTGGASISWECDALRLTERGRSLADPAALAETLSGTVGHTLTPCAAIRLTLRLNPGETRETGFVAGVTDDVSAFAARHAGASGDERAFELAATQSRALYRHLAVPAPLGGLIDRSSALFTDVHPGESGLHELPDGDDPACLLWPLGVSGDRAMIAGFCRSLSGVDTARDLMRLYEYHRAMGLDYDLILVNDYGNDYDCPVLDRLKALVAASSAPAVLLDGALITADQRRLLRMAAALVIDCDVSSLRAQLKSALETKRAGREEQSVLTPSEKLESDAEKDAFNGWGGFDAARRERYIIEETPTPAPWCNILCNEIFGTMTTERGGSFTWFMNSREGRLTPFDNDILRDDSGERLRLSFSGLSTDPEGLAARVTHTQGESVYEGRLSGVGWQSRVFVDRELPVKAHMLTLKNTRSKPIRVKIEACVRWIMGVFREDERYVRRGGGDGLIWARGQIGTAAFMTFAGENARVEDDRLALEFEIPAGGEKRLELLMGCGHTMGEIRVLVDQWTEKGGAHYLERTLAFWDERLSRLEIETPDPLFNAAVNRWLPYQVISARLWGRAGFYQSGGAFGFRDQLQDQLSQLQTAPQDVRAHIIESAAHQFKSGDVQHWWHPPRRGVRTRISDDMLFLPYVAGCYVRETGDESILDETIPFLEDETIPEGREDWYGDARESDERATLREHGLRAIDRAAQFGEHGLLLMGTGDWNDGMNRVGREGRGESVWLSEFMIAVIQVFAPCCEEADRERLKALSDRLRESVEREGWDGGWYLRAYDDQGEKLGGHECGECQIDSLPQSWAVLAGLDRVRCQAAMNAVSESLIDRKHGLIRLLTPPFDGESAPGYIRGYPPGVRENGGQYTHAACWVVLALAALGRAGEAWEAARMLLPASHGDTREKEAIYRVEPYVMAADVYDGAPHAGRGGWTWYTGAAGWMLRAVRNGLCGLQWRGGAVTMSALLPEGWASVSATIRVGAASYTLVSSRDCDRARLDGEPLEDGFIRPIDDGAHHKAVFPARAAEKKEE